MILCVISMFIYACECIGLHNIVIMMYMYLATDCMLYPINDLNWIELNNWSAPNSGEILPVQRQRLWSRYVFLKYISIQNPNKTKL